MALQGFFVEGYSNHLYRLKGKDRIVMQAVRSLSSFCRRLCDALCRIAS
jgi:hypothetical protein